MPAAAMKSRVPLPTQPGEWTPARWAALHRELIRRYVDAGLEVPTRGAYWWRGGFVSVVFFFAYGVLLTEPDWLLRLLALVASTFAAIQGGMLSHDLAHRNVTSRRWMTRALGQFFMTLMTGQTYAHWEWQHLKHHRHTQEPFNDPDMEVSFFALSHEDAARKKGLHRWTTAHQHLLIWPLVTLQVFSIRATTVGFLIQNWKRTALDRWCFLGHLVLWVVLPGLHFGFGPALLNYVLYTWFMGPYAAASFLWNHVGLPSVPPGANAPYFFQRLHASRNLVASPVLNFLVGGLNFHIEHHLAPQVPSARLPAARGILVELLRENGLPYREWRFWEAMVDVHRHLRSYAFTARMTGKHVDVGGPPVDPERALSV